MTLELLTQAPIALLPVVIFLLALLYLDSYKLLRFRTVAFVILSGSLTTVACYFINGWLFPFLSLEPSGFSRFIAPIVEETAKALIIVFLFKINRIGFLVDSALLGFAVGAGFALAENIHYLLTTPGASTGVWIVRGFGTAVMHGGVTAMFGIVSQALTERNMNINPALYLPGLLIAITLHSLFNHFPVEPITQTLIILVSLPPLLVIVFWRSAQHLHSWLQIDFDEDAELLGLIQSGDFVDSRAGRFLEDLKQSFPGPIVVDMLCYLRLYTELALRAKGLLMAREHGLDAPAGERTKEKFEELAFLEKSIGKTGVLAMRPFLQMTRKDLWQLYMIE